MVNYWKDPQQDEHRRCLEFIRKRWKLASLVVILNNPLKSFADVDGNGETPAEEEAPRETAAEALDRTAGAIPPEEPLRPVERPPLSVNDYSQRPPASYSETSQMTAMDVNPRISSAMLPKIWKIGTSLELKPHKDERMASPKIETELNKADPEWDEPLHGEPTKEAGSVLEEMASRKDVAYPRSTRPIGGKGDPELRGWWDRGKPASPTRLHFGHGP